MMTDELAEWDTLTARIYADRDFTPGGREVALALAWVLYRDDSEPGSRWKRVREILGTTSGPYPQWRIWGAIGEDLPYYAPGNWRAGGGECEGPRLRPYKPRRGPDAGRCLVSDHHPHLGDCQFTQIWFAHEDGTVTDQPGPRHITHPPERDDRVCGAHGTIEITEEDMVTGWETSHWFCRRHLERAKEVKAQLAARGEPPPPIPNRGGVLPRYFKADWAERYSCALKYPLGWRVHPPCGWEPPYHGLCRDDWPVPGKTIVPRRPRLAVVS